MISKKKQDLILNVIDKIYIIAYLLFVFSIVSCVGRKKTVEKVSELKVETLAETTDTLIATKEIKVEEIIFKGIEDSFNIKPDTLTGEIPEFVKQFDTGSVKGEIGYSKEKGSYYNIETKDLKETTSETTIDTTRSKNESLSSNKSYSSIENTDVRRGVGFFFWLKWITFVIIILIVILIIRKIKRRASSLGLTGAIKSVFK